MRKTLNLRLVLAIVISLLAFGLTGGATLMVGGAGIAGVEQGIDNSLLLLADQMQDKLNRALFERLRDIADTARLFSAFNLASRPDAMGRWLDELRGAGDDYTWIGFVSTDGRVVRGTGRLHEGEDVSQRPWFRKALEGRVRDTRDVTLEEPAKTTPATGAGALLDIAQPVLEKSGTISGVLVAEINWAWADQIRASITRRLRPERGPDILLISSVGTVLLGPPKLLGKPLDLSNKATPADQVGIFEGRRYLYAYAKAGGYRNFSGLGWSVIVRQDAEVAMAPVHALQREMVMWGLGLSVLAAIAAWTVAGLIAAPLLRLARAAQSIQSGADMQMPEVDSYAEAKVLSRSFASLVSDLKHREKALESLNETLESQVAMRTNELALRNKALAAAYADAEKATQAKSRFLTAASHDLRQPLHAMTLFARALSRRVHGAEPERLVGQIEESLRSLKGMFDALLNVSKLDAGLIQPTPSTISVKALIDRVSEGFRVDAESRGLRFLSRSVEASLRTDPVLLETMLRNLVSNALKFTRTGGVALIARRLDGTMAFQVLDTGPGIDEERQQRIFDEFERAREQAGGLNEGLGLGLSIVRRYAGLLGIEVKLSSRPAHGTCFSLIVPPPAVVDAPLSYEHGASLNAAPALPQNMRVLVMDDDPMIVAALTRDLADRGCEPKGATSTVEAEEILSRGFKADALIVDFDLGGKETGLAFLGRMERKYFRKIPGLILTGGTDATTLAAMTTSGVPWLTKPADPDVLASALAGIVATRNMSGRGRERGRGENHESAHSG
jgi:signal transduction histidine kinase/ActR/RegA family two-component response regulator